MIKRTLLEDLCFILFALLLWACHITMVCIAPLLEILQLKETEQEWICFLLKAISL